MKRLVIGSRGSSLALWQARWVQSSLRERLPDTEVEIRVIRTQGDSAQDVPFEQLPGKGFFVKEIEEALLGETIDLAVHSMKDLPDDLPPGLRIAATTAREDPRDALVTAAGIGLAELPAGAKVGTGSPRRAGQLAALRPDLEIRPLRGNVDTRVRRLLEGRHDAIVLAAAGLFRLELDVPRVPLEVEMCTPAVGQGALGLEVRGADEPAAAAAALLNHAPTAQAVMAERAFLSALGGGCRVPIGGYGRVEDGELQMVGVVARADGSALVRDRWKGSSEHPQQVGQELARRLLERGAAELLDEEPSTATPPEKR